MLLAVALVAMLVSFSLENRLALATSALVWALALYSLITLEKRFELRTYREIRTFCNGKSLEEIEVERESAPLGASTIKRVVAGGCAGVVIGLSATLLVRLLS